MSDDPRTALLHRVEADQVAFINLQFTDVLGIGKTVTIPVEELPDALDHGVWFDGSSIEGFARMVESDMYLVPDISTYAVVPWDQHQGVTTARLICSVYTPDGKPFAGDPRNVLRRMLDQAAAAGYRFMVAPELEFFLFKTDPNGNILEPHDKASYFDISTDLATHIRRQMARTLQAMGIAVEAVHHEVAPGQHEIDLRYADALQSADHLVTARVALKAVAQMNGLHATFMPSLSPVSMAAGCMSIRVCSTAIRGRISSPIQMIPTAFRRWLATLSPVCWRTPVGCAPCLPR